MKNIRTQITLPQELKEKIEQEATLKGQSLAEYLRVAALHELKRADKEKKELEDLANTVIGSLDLSKHPEWNTPEKVNTWSRKVRVEWEGNEYPV